MPETAPLSDLSAIEAAVWHELETAAASRDHAWRFMVLATRAAEADGGVDARTVVLREVDAAARDLVFFTDARAGKAAQLRGWPQARLVMWSPARGWQLRIAAAVELHTEGLQVSSRWARLKMKPAAQDYLSPLPPGTPLGAAPVPPSRGEREHFAVAVARVAAIDWLELAASGHRRARFDAQGRRWLVP